MSSLAARPKRSEAEVFESFGGAVPDAGIRPRALHGSLLVGDQLLACTRDGKVVRPAGDPVVRLDDGVGEELLPFGSAHRKDRDATALGEFAQSVGELAFPWRRTPVTRCAVRRRRDRRAPPVAGHAPGGPSGGAVPDRRGRRSGPRSGVRRRLGHRRRDARPWSGPAGSCACGGIRRRLWAGQATTSGSRNSLSVPSRSGWKSSRFRLSISCLT